MLNTVEAKQKYSIGINDNILLYFSIFQEKVLKKLTPPPPKKKITATIENGDATGVLKASVKVMLPETSPETD